jgi:hypothetical protein
MSNSIHAATTDTAASTAPSVAANRTTKDELLSRAKAAIDAGEQSLHVAAEALALAQDDFNATQREIASAVGKSPAWVNALLKWQRSGCKDDSPFGPKSKAARVQHAEQRVKASKPSAVTPKNQALFDFTVRVRDLVRRIGMFRPEHFAGTKVAADDLAKVGKFLSDLATLKKDAFSKPTSTTHSEGNGIGRRR